MLSMPKPGSPASQRVGCLPKYSDRAIHVSVLVWTRGCLLMGQYIAFVDMLNQMRIGIVEATTVEKFTRIERPLVYPDGLEPTQLYVND